MRELNSRKSPTARKILFSEDSRLETATEGMDGGIDVVRDMVIACVIKTDLRLKLASS